MLSTVRVKPVAAAVRPARRASAPRAPVAAANPTRRAPVASLTPTRRDTLLAGLAAVVIGAPPLPATAATAAVKKLPKLDAKRVYGSLDKAEAARAAALDALAPVITGENAGNLLRFAFHDAGTWDAAARTGGANGSLFAELDRPENGGLKYGASILNSAYTSIKGPKLTKADFIQVAGAAAVAATGGPAIAVPLGRPDARAADPGGQLPPKTLDAAGLEELFGRNGYTVRDVVALSGAHTIGSSRANDPKGAMTATPAVFDNSYFKLLLKGGGAFPSDKALVKAPETKAIVQEFAKSQDAFFSAFAEAYVKMGLKGLDA